MALKFEVNRLASDELSYELEIRGIVGLATVAEMRKTLRNLLRLEKSPTPLTYPDHPYTFEEDVTAVAQKLDEIGGLVESFEGVRDATYAKIISKIAHALGRVNKSRATEAAEESRKSRLIVSLLNLHSTANSKARRRERSSLNQSAGVVDVDLMEGSGDETSSADDDVDGAVGTPVTPRAASSPTVQRPPSVPISKWNVKYSGDDRDMSLSAFLARVEELMVARHATKQDLFDCAIDLFSGKALIWYRANRKNATEWNSLVTLLRGQFQPADFNDRLFDEIRQRTQGSDETIGLYLAVIDGLFDRLTIKVAEPVRLKIILRNLSPFYQSQISVHPVRSRDELLGVGRVLEASKASVESFVPPVTRKNRKFLEPDLAYVSSGPSTAAIASTDEPSSSAAPNRQNVTGCNCQKLGHIRSECPAPKKLLCYRCGKPDHTVRNCPNCSGNAKGGR
jgi:hypothetical protein